MPRNLFGRIKKKNTQIEIHADGEITLKDELSTKDFEVEQEEEVQEDATED